MTIKMALFTDMTYSAFENKFYLRRKINENKFTIDVIFSIRKLELSSELRSSIGTIHLLNFYFLTSTMKFILCNKQKMQYLCKNQRTV